MRRIGKTRKGFTLGGTLIVAIGRYLNGANSAVTSVSQHNSQIDYVYDVCEEAINNR